MEEHKNQVKEPKVIPLEKQEEKRIQKVEDSVRSLWDNFKHTKIYIMRMPKEERERKILKIYLKK